jgi:hypothetical protein
MKYIVRHQALELLFYSRLLLLNQRSAHGRSHSEPDLLVELVAKEAPHHSSCSNHKHNCECLPTFRNSHSDPSIPIDDPHASNSHFPFTRLPTEIQLMILSQLAPILSSSQQIRIFEYAIDKTTLPDLSLRLPSSNGTSHKTASSGAGPGFFGSTYLAQRSRSFATMNVTFIPDMTEKEKWLELAGCDAYDPNP